MEHVICSAPGRMALVGNPFDIYGGMTISMTLKNLRSVVEVKKSSQQIIHSDIFITGNQRTSQRRQLELATIETLDLQHHLFEHYDGSNMPYESALARSSAAVVAMIRAYNSLFSRGIISNYEIAELAWMTERKLGVCGGQERYAIAFDDCELKEAELEALLRDIRRKRKVNETAPGKVFFMDFKGREDHYFNGHNFAFIRELSVPKTEFAVVYPPTERARLNSFSIHQKLREKYVNGHKDEIEEYRDESNEITKKALDTLANSFDANVLGKCMTSSLNLRLRMYEKLLADELEGQPLCEETYRMIRIAKKKGIIGYNQPGSKSLCFILSDESELDAFKDEGYEAIRVFQEKHF